MRVWVLPNFWTPCLRPPVRKASPSTSRLFASTEPIRADCTTATSPSCSAKIAMNSSGRLPSADCRTPVAPCPRRLPNWSVPSPTSEASPASATAEKMNTSTLFAPALLKAKVITVATTVTASVISTLRPNRFSMPVMLTSVVGKMERLKVRKL